MTYRGLATTDPDGNHIFWGSETSRPVGEWALNFGRIEDDVIDESFDTIHSNPDPELRREASELINRRFAEQVYNVWIAWSMWAVASVPHVHQVAPSGMTGGNHPVSQIWVDQ
jgi:hypothetical protein